MKSSPLPWVRRALLACERWVELAPPELRSRLKRAYEHVGSKQRATSVEGALTSPLATPGFALMEAYRVDLRLPEEGAIDLVAEGALALYFYLRLQDDIIDEPTTFDPSFQYAGELFAGVSTEAFATALATRRTEFWAFRRTTLEVLSATSAWEIDTFRRMSPEDAGASAEQHAARLGLKLLAIAIPLAGLAAVAGVEEQLPWIDRFSRSFGAALQIINDLLNARDDHVGRRITPVLAALYSGGQVSPSTEPFRVLPALVGGAAFGRMVRAAREHLESAASLARASGAPRTAEVVEARVPMLEELTPLLLRMALGVNP